MTAPAWRKRPRFELPTAYRRLCELSPGDVFAYGTASSHSAWREVVSRTAHRSLVVQAENGMVSEVRWKRDDVIVIHP